MVDNTLLIENLAKTKDPYYKEKFEDVDWEAVHALRVRAPMYIQFPDEVNEKQRQDEWVYVRRDTKLSFNEAHIVGVAFANSETAAIYRRQEGSESWLYWERRMHFTSGLTLEEKQLISKKAREFKAEGGYSFISSKG